MKYLRMAAAALILTAAFAPVRADADPVDLAPLFAPATAAEAADVAADWAARIVTPSTFEIDGTGSADGFDFARVRYRLTGLDLYGAVRYPRDFTPGGRFPVLVALHGGSSGLDLNWLRTFDAEFPSGCVADSFVVIAPTFRSELLNGQGVLGSRTSEGAASPFGRDGDDALALLEAVLQLVPEADPARVSAFSRSRGGPAAYQLLLRDERVRRAVTLFGPADFFLDHVRTGAEEFLTAGETQDRLGDLVGEYIAAPWLAGDITLAEARHLLLSWSTPQHLNGPLHAQLHHGVYDDVVPPDQSRTLHAAAVAEGSAAPDHEYFEYPLGGHIPSTLEGYEARAEAYLCALLQVTAAPPPAPTLRLRGRPNPFGDAVTLRLEPPTEKSGMLPVEILDMRGRTVARLQSADSVRWDGRDFQGNPTPSGTYLARVSGRPELPPTRLLRLR